MSALNTRLFANLCAELGSDHKCLLFYTEVRWLSRGNMTRKIFELGNDLLEFYEKRNHHFKNNLASTEFLSRLAYLSDIFDTASHIHMFFQDQNSIISDFVSKLQAYLRKLDLWKMNIEVKQYHMFKDLSSLQHQQSKKLFQEICYHLKLLKTELKHYFPNKDSSPYVSNPFFVDPFVLPVGTEEQKEIIEIQSDEAAKVKHKECCRIDFWLTMSSTYPTLTQKAIPQLLAIPSTWECEQDFSAMMNIKSESRNRLASTSHDFRYAVSTVAPRRNQLAQEKQMQPSLWIILLFLLKLI